MKCPRCGYEVTQGSIKCINCGYEFVSPKEFTNVPSKPKRFSDKYLFESKEHRFDMPKFLVGFVIILFLLCAVTHPDHALFWILTVIAAVVWGILFVIQKILRGIDGVRSLKKDAEYIKDVREWKKQTKGRK